MSPYTRVLLESPRGHPTQELSGCSPLVALGLAYSNSRTRLYARHRLGVAQARPQPQEIGTESDRGIAHRESL